MSMQKQRRSRYQVCVRTTKFDPLAFVGHLVSGDFFATIAHHYSGQNFWSLAFVDDECGLDKRSQLIWKAKAKERFF